MSTLDAGKRKRYRLKMNNGETGYFETDDIFNLLRDTGLAYIGVTWIIVAMECPEGGLRETYVNANEISYIQECDGTEESERMEKEKEAKE